MDSQGSTACGLLVAVGLCASCGRFGYDGQLTCADPAADPELCDSGIDAGCQEGDVCDTAVIEVEVGTAFACARHRSGRVSCWGANERGQLGVGEESAGTSSPAYVLNPAGTAPLEGVRQITAGPALACAILADATAVCWGANIARDGLHSLGDGQDRGHSLPAQVLDPDGSAPLGDLVEIRADSAVLCARDGAGGVYCWGHTHGYGLGDGDTNTSVLPVRVALPADEGGTAGLLADAIDIDVMASAACAVRSTGQVVCWGYGSHGQLAQGDDSSSPLPVTVLDAGGGAPLENATGIASAFYHACAQLADSTAMCWGRANVGQLGSATAGWSEPLPVPVSDLAGDGILTGIEHLDCGRESSCARLATGELVCWGRNNIGQLGDGTTVDRRIPVPVQGVGGSGSLVDLIDTSIGTGSATNTKCAVQQDGSVVCWGSNSSGQLGLGTELGQPLPSRVLSVPDATRLSVGSVHACAIRSGPPGPAVCWGRSSEGELGDGTATSSSVPGAVAGIAAFSSVSAGQQHTCGIYDATNEGGGDGALACWGSDDSGQLGDGAGRQSQMQPAQVEGMDGSGSAAVQVAGADNHTCVVTAGGGAQCWGYNLFGQLGIGSWDYGTHLVPEVVVGIGGAGTLSNVEEIRAGGSHSCARLSDGSVACWGRALVSELVDAEPNPTPVVVEGLAGVAQLCAGDHFVCARTTGGGQNVHCWGDNRFGQLGDGTAADSPVPVAVGEVSGAIAVACGYSHACAVLADETVRCWGSNRFGQLGDGTTTPGPAPVAVLDESGAASLAGIVDVSAGTEMSCALGRDGAIYCWGRSAQGELGNGSAILHSGPEPVTGLP